MKSGRAAKVSKHVSVDLAHIFVKKKSKGHAMGKLLNFKYNLCMPPFCWDAPVYQKAFGKANLEPGDELAVDDVFQPGSMKKQFIAVAILMSEQQGKRCVEAPFSKYIPDYQL